MVDEKPPQVKRQHTPTPRANSRIQPYLPDQKTALVDLGLALLVMGEMGAVAAITRIVRERGLCGV